MEVEESSDEGEFRPVPEKRKRKKTSDDESVVGNGREEENLLKNNKFSQLLENNNNNNGDGAGNGGSSSASAAKQLQKQPPLVVKNMRFNKLRDIIKLGRVKPAYKITSFGIKLFSHQPDNHDTLRKHLIENNVEFYTHEKRSERPYRAVIRGLPQMAPERVKQLLKEYHNLDALEVYAVKCKEGLPAKEEVPYIVMFPKGYTNLKKLQEIKRFRCVMVRWEAYRNKRPNVTQCTNCLHLGHGTRNCHLKGRCNNCGGSHKTDECQAPEAEVKRCANCAGGHKATDRSCPKRAEFIRARQQAAKGKQPIKKMEKPRPPVPELTPENFPPLPGVVPGEQSPQPGGSKGGTGSSAGGTGVGGSQENIGTRGDANPKADEKEVLYTWEEVWRISLEYSARLKNCRTRSDQVAVIGYMAGKYGSK